MPTCRLRGRFRSAIEAAVPKDTPYMRGLMLCRLAMLASTVMTVAGVVYETATLAEMRRHMNR